VFRDETAGSGAFKHNACKCRDMYLDGIILRGRSFEPVEGRLIIQDGQIAAIDERANRSPSQFSK